MDKRMVPKIVGKKIEEARKILKDENIEIEKEKKKIDIFEHSGNVIKVEPEEGSKLKKQDKVILYVSNRKPILVIFLLFLVCVLFGNSTLGEMTIKGIEDKTIKVLNLNKPTAPEITGGSKEWALSRVIKVKKDSYAKKGLDYYEYCITTNKNLKKCKWEKTSTKNVKLSETGKYYVVFRGVDKAGNTSSNSNIEIAYIDNSNPVINEVNVKNKKVIIEATDKESGVDKYYYSLDGENYKETKKKFEIKDDVKEIYIKVVDKVGNKVISVIPIENGKINDETTTKVTKTTTTTKKQDNNGTTSPSSSTTTTKNAGQISTSTTTTSTTSTGTTSTTTTTKKGMEYDIPKINLDKVPLEFIYGSEYELPSEVEFGNDTGTYKCVVEGKEVNTTKDLAIGKHLIVCEATSSHNKKTLVEKEVEVRVKSGEEEIWDGWIRLNLNYPDNSTNWEWRIGKEGEIRDGYDYTGWQDYTGPILVKLDNVKDVYIRYDLLGETYIIAPNGRVAVDIEPTSYTLEGSNQTEVKIVYDKTAEVKEYRVAGGEWQEYKGVFKVGRNTLIEARGIRDEKVYDSDGNYLYTKKVTGTDSVFIGEANVTSGGSGTAGGSNSSGNTFEYEPVKRTDGTNTTKPKDDTLPSTYLDGPEIKVNPTSELVESVKVSVIPQEPARKIYIMFGYGIYQEYTGEITVSKNTLVRAYYVRDSDGKSSEVTSYYIQNIKAKNKPYVRIDATPDYLSKNVNEVKVNISGSNYTKLEYSLDGVIYQNYTGEITVTRSTTIYAKGTNEYGETIEELNVTTTSTPVEKDNIDISIDISPKKEEIKGLVNKAKVKITYENKATKKYYKLGFYGEWKEYTGEFEITDNVTIYAYATGNNAVGKTEKSINYLTTGIANPIITIEPTGKAQQVKVSIEYASTAEITRYKIGNQEYRDYNGSFYVYENETIYAYNKDELGNEGTSEYTIKNIVGNPNYVAIDKGKYYIIKLNYPETSSVREYKWKSDGVWKEYNGYGVLLIKNEYKNEFTNIKDGIKVEDEYGKEIIFTDHYYFIDVPFSELMENLFMRWDTTKINAPSIIETPEEVTKEASISIVYNKSLVNKLYKIVYEDGEETEWLTYEKPFTINKNKATIFAKGVSRSGIDSKVASKTITNIDNDSPEIEVKGNFSKPARQINVTVYAKDNFGVDKVKWTYGEENLDYFKKNGNAIRNVSSFKVEENGKYTIYAVDKVGNEVIKVIEITNIDKDAPNIRINVLTETFGTETEIEIDYGDSVNKQYKIGKNGTYKEYTENLVIKSNDVLDLANEDGSLTIYAKGKDEAGNEREISEDIYILDLDAPKEPVITAGAGYPILTEYGVKLGSKSYIKFDDRDDITNYYSTDNGTSWKIYTGPFDITSGSIKARSVKNNSGLVIETTKEVDMPEDALGSNAYDGDENTYVYGKQVSYYLNISSEMKGKSLSFIGSAINQEYTPESIIFIMLDENSKQLSTQQFSKTSIKYKGTVEIPEKTTKLQIVFNQGRNRDTTTAPVLYEIKPDNTPVIRNSKYYPLLTDRGVKNGYNEVTIEYFLTSEQKLYKINDGDWKEYEGKTIKLLENDKIEAKGIDRNGNETETKIYTAELPADALASNAYDEDEETYVYGQLVSYYLDISSEMNGKSLSFIGSAINQEYFPESITFITLDENSKQLSTQQFSKTPVKYKGIIDIPSQAVKLKIEFGRGRNRDTTTSPILYEIYPSKEPYIFETNYYPVVGQDKISQSIINVDISYLSYFTKKLYSLDNGNTWLDYNGTFTAKVGDKIQAKAVDKDGNETEVTTYTVKGLSDSLDDKAFDSDKSTSITLSSKQTKSFNIEDLDNEVLRIYTTGSISTSAYIKLYDKDNKELETVTFNTDLTTLVILEGTVKASIYSGTSSMTIKEINLRKPVSLKEYPEIQINNSEWAISKKIEIVYPENTIGEYSLDLGTTWNEYNGILSVEKETIIFARAKENDKVVSSSSFIVKKVDNIDPTIELEIPETIVEGSNYEIPTSTTFGNSGGSAICKINDKEITSTKELVKGSYEIKCEAMSNLGKKTSKAKNLNVIEKIDLSFDYTGSEQVFTAPVSGKYKLETWGAQGGSLNSNYLGGYGAYSTGIVSLSINDKLYINIGGKGAGATAQGQTLEGGYNGGGSVEGRNVIHMNASGGGATHISTISGLLSSLENAKDSILIVSAGGGGARDQANHVSAARWGLGGSGGGVVGVGPISSYGSTTSYTTVSELAGTQTSGYAFGKGKMAIGNSGGGSGWYGGFGGDDDTYYAGAGAGGSSYIGNPLLTEKSMYCYNCEESTEENTKTISTTNVSETPTSNYAKIGNGYARITYIGE